MPPAATRCDGRGGRSVECGPRPLRAGLCRGDTLADSGASTLAPRLAARRRRTNRRPDTPSHRGIGRRAFPPVAIGSHCPSADRGPACTAGAHPRPIGPYTVATGMPFTLSVTSTDFRAERGAWREVKLAGQPQSVGGVARFKHRIQFVRGLEVRRAERSTVALEPMSQRGKRAVDVHPLAQIPEELLSGPVAVQGLQAWPTPSAGSRG